MRFVFFGGKGGVGKTTCAAAAAVRAAGKGARVLIVSTDPAHSLGDALDLELGAEPRRVKEISRTGEVWAAELDADRALARWLKTKEEAIRTRPTAEPARDGLGPLAIPGVDELVGLLELLRLARQRDYAEVIVDTAPTGHTLRLLETPDALERVGAALHRHYNLEIGEEAGELRALLTDPERAAFTWVTLPEEPSVVEAERAVAEIEEHGMLVDVIVVNRVWPVPDRACPLCSPRVEYEREWKERIASRFVGKTILEAPARIAEPREPSELAALSTSIHPLDVSAPTKLPKRGPRLDLEEMATIATGSSALSPIADTVRVAFFGGKGGVGKTTVAAACALDRAAERPRERVLLLSTDPAHSLGDVLGSEIGDTARKVPKAPANLRVRELDAAKAWKTERERLGDVLDLAPPGLDELIALVTVLDALVGDEPAWDLVIVDTAPTGRTLRLLSLPEKALEWSETLLARLERSAGAEAIGERAAHVARLASRLRYFLELLVDPVRCAFIVVTRPAALPRLETERLAKELRQRRIPVTAIVANAVSNPTCSRCIVAANEERGELAKLERLASRAARSPRLIVTPAVYPGPHGVRELRLFRDQWTERGTRAS